MTTAEITTETETTEVVTTFEDLISVLLSERTTLETSNQKNAELFNKLQEFITEKTTGVTQVDGAISALSGFITDETPEDDKHVVELTKLQTQRNELVQELQTADTQRRNIFSTITMTEGALQVIRQVLSRTDHVENQETTEVTEETV